MYEVHMICLQQTSSLMQELYLWESVADAGRRAIKMRYRHLYTAPLQLLLAMHTYPRIMQELYLWEQVVEMQAGVLARCATGCCPNSTQPFTGSLGRC